MSDIRVARKLFERNVRPRRRRSQGTGGRPSDAVAAQKQVPRAPRPLPMAAEHRLWPLPLQQLDRDQANAAKSSSP